MARALRDIKKEDKGSSLLGVALLTLVMGFLMSGGIQLINTHNAVQAKIESEEKTYGLKAALKSYVRLHKRYPCPAKIDIPPDQSGFGQEDCSIADVSGRDGLGVKIGTVPVRTLNIPDNKIVDGYGRRFIYAVTTDRTASDGTADPRNGQGAITILHSLDGFEQSVSTPEGYIIYAIMSPGQDDRGAYDINGNQVLPCDSTSLAGENCDFDDALFKTTETATAGKNTDFNHKFTFVARGPEHYWYTSPWSECGKQLNGIKWSGQTRGSVTASRPVCFSSYQERQVVCRDKQGNDVSDTMCQHTDTPLEMRSCSIGP